MAEYKQQCYYCEHRQESNLFVGDRFGGGEETVLWCAKKQDNRGELYASNEKRCPEFSQE